MGLYPLAGRDYDPNSVIQMNQVMLHLRRFATSRRLGSNAVARMRLNVYREPSILPGLGEDLVVELETYVLTQRLAEESFTVNIQGNHVYSEWATWWDHFKSEQVDATSPLWRWVARRWPPQKVTRQVPVTLSRSVTPAPDALVPEARIAASSPSLGAPVIYEYWEQP